MSTEMKRETVGWQHVAAAPSHTHIEREGKREERDTHIYTLLLFRKWSAATAAVALQQLERALGKGLWVWLGIGAGIWLKFSLLAWQRRTFTNKSNLHQNFIYLVLPLLCVDALCVCVCVCAAAAAKLLGLPARVKVKLYLYLPVAKSEITSEMHAESARPWNDLQSGHICMRVPPFFYKIFPYSLLISRSDIWYWNRVAAP